MSTFIKLAVVGAMVTTTAYLACQIVSSNMHAVVRALEIACR